jgi:Bacterial sugar transferase
VRTWRYASAMRSVRQHQLSSWRADERGVADRMRRFADVVIACVLLAISAPLMIGVALSIKSESPGPIFVRHARIGRSGRRFQMLKFRSLIEDPGCTKPVWVRKTTQIRYATDAFVCRSRASEHDPGSGNYPVLAAAGRRHRTTGRWQLFGQRPIPDVTLRAYHSCQPDANEAAQASLRIASCGESPSILALADKYARVQRLTAAGLSKEISARGSPTNDRTTGLGRTFSFARASASDANSIGGPAMTALGQLESCVARPPTSHSRRNQTVRPQLTAPHSNDLGSVAPQKGTAPSGTR